MMDLNQNWQSYNFIAFDTETSGAYPLEGEIVEFGAVKANVSSELAVFESLFKPKMPMSDFNISIHGITNEMVTEAPRLKEKAKEISEFLKDSVLLAHHAPFDMGFVTLAFESSQINIPAVPVICTSLLARKLIPESHNHKLQTLIKTLNLPQGKAHRALDDARACLAVGFECFRRTGEQTKLSELIELMGKPLVWENYRILSFDSQSKIGTIRDAVVQGKDVDFIYVGGTLRGKTRRITPIGIVRNPDGDYVMARCHVDGGNKRFYFDKITDPLVVYG